MLYNDIGEAKYMEGKKRVKGFTLIELMIVVAIVGILSAMAIPNFQKFRSRAIQAEARANLGAINTCQTIYFGDFDTFAGGPNAFLDIRYVPVTGTKRYTYILGQAVLPADFTVSPVPSGCNTTANGFTAIAVGNIDNDPFIDFWAVNDQREIRNAVNNCSSWAGDGSDLRN